MDLTYNVGMQKQTNFSFFHDRKENKCGNWHTAPSADKHSNLINRVVN